MLRAVRPLAVPLLIVLVLPAFAANETGEQTVTPIVPQREQRIEPIAAPDEQHVQALAGDGQQGVAAPATHGPLRQTADVAAKIVLSVVGGAIAVGSVIAGLLLF